MESSEKVVDGAPAVAVSDGAQDVAAKYSYDIEEEALTDEELSSYINRFTFPARYASLFKRVKDIKLHKNLLDAAKNPENNAVLHVQAFESIEADGEAVVQREDAFYEVIFSTTDKTDVLVQLPTLLAAMLLNIREAYVLSTTDGYALSVFVLAGWPTGDTEGLRSQVEAAVIRRSKISLSSSGSGASTEWKTITCVCEQTIKSLDINTSLLVRGDRIGCGVNTYSYRGVYDDEDVFVKILRSDLLYKRHYFEHEVSFLRVIKQRNIVRFIGAYLKHPEFMILTEYMAGGSLFDYVVKNGAVTDLPQLVKFAVDVSRAMEYLHKRNILHRDLQLRNLLLDDQNVVKLTDFADSRLHNPEEYHVPSARGRQRTWLQQPVDQLADIRSFAVILWELFTGEVVHDYEDVNRSLFPEFEGYRPDVLRDMHPSLLDLMRRCMAAAPVVPPTFSHIRDEVEHLLSIVQAEPYEDDDQ